MAMMTGAEKRTWIIMGAIVVVVVLLGVLWYDSATQIPTVKTEGDYEAVVGETIEITLPNYQVSDTEQNLYNRSYDYNYSYQWNISGTTDQNMFRHMNTVRTATQTTFYYKALEAGNATLTFQYRVENVKRWLFTANIVVTEE